MVDAPIDQCLHRFAGATDDGLFVHVEAGIEDEGDAGEAVVLVDERPVLDIAVAPHQLRPRRAVDMHHRGNPRLPVLFHVERDGHELRRVPPRVDVLEYFVRMLGERGRGEWHELAAFQARVEPGVDRLVHGRGHHGPIAQGTRTKFHRPLEPADHPPRMHGLGGTFCDLLEADLLVGDSAGIERVLDLIARWRRTPIHVVEALHAAREISRIEHILHQQGSADAVAGIGHRGKNKQLVTTRERRQALIQLDIGEHAAVDRKMAHAGRRKEIRAQRHDGLFEHRLGRRRDVFARMAANRLGKKFLAAVVGPVKAREIRIETIAVGRQAQGAAKRRT